MTAEQVLRERAEALARETDDQERGDILSLLLFRVVDEQYAVEVSAVREIFQEYRVTPIPCVPDFVLGVINIRGEILSVCDAARLMHLGSNRPDSDGARPAIVIEREEVATALVVDEIGDIAEVRQEAVEPPVGSLDRANAEFVCATVEIDGSLVSLIKATRILEPITSTRH